MKQDFILPRIITVTMVAMTLIVPFAPAWADDDEGAVPTVELKMLGSYASGIFRQGGAEIVAHDPVLQRLFVVNANTSSLDVLGISDPTAPTKITSITFAAGASPNSAAVYGNVLVVAVQDAEKTNPGKAFFFNTGTLAPLSVVTLGALPDMVTFTPNGRYVLVANEGEPNDAYTIDPEGSVSIIDMSPGADNLTDANVRQVGFAAFNNAELDRSIRIFGPGASVAQDLEPEYIAVSPDSRTAYVTLQENNAIGIIDIQAGKVTELRGLGFKNHRAKNRGLDASDRDKAVNIQRWPVWGMYLPDGIAAFDHEGETFLVLANEGDVRDYTGFKEEATVSGLVLNRRNFPDRANLQKDTALGRLKVTKTLGDVNGDGDYEQLYSYGARSFSIRNASAELVYDSGDDFEVTTAAVYPATFNASNDNNTFDNRSDDKGPEPEGVAVGYAFGRRYAFIVLERVGGIMVYDISNPEHPEFMDYANHRDFSVPPAADKIPPASPSTGDLGPEGVIFIGAKNSPNGKPLVVVGNEISGTTTIYKLDIVQ